MNNKKKTDPFDIVTGIVLRNRRLYCTDMSQREASEKIGKSKQWMSDVENGKMGIYWYDFKALCDLYNLNLNTVSMNINFAYTYMQEHDYSYEYIQRLDYDSLSRVKCLTKD